MCGNGCRRRFCIGSLRGVSIALLGARLLLLGLSLAFSFRRRRMHPPMVANGFQKSCMAPSARPANYSCQICPRKKKTNKHEKN
jgi:hypothetical protein